MKWIKFLIGCLLSPVLVAQLWTLAELAATWWPAGEWHAGWFLSFIGGVLAWLLIYFLLPRPLWIYVFGHELTHALAVYMAGGKVFDFRVSSGGGHVKADRMNWWIALAPYFVPLYSVLWLMIWWSINFYYPLQSYQIILYSGLGLTWAFHITFTISMIQLGQTDISSQGFTFSAVIILGVNLLVVLFGFALITAPWKILDSFHLLIHKILICYTILGKGLFRFTRLIQRVMAVLPARL